MSEIIYVLHQMRDVAISIWRLSPPAMMIIAVVLAGVVYFVFKH